MSLYNYEVFGKKIYLNIENGDIFDDLSFLQLNSKSLNKEIYLQNFKNTSYYFCLNIVNSCNLCCKYCFNKNKNFDLMDSELAIKSLDKLFSIFSDGEKYFIDLSGKGEPLLNKKTIKIVADYCKTKMNELMVEIVPTLVCNGTLLDKSNVDFLEKCNILYGVSIDGNKETHDLNRRTINGAPTYDLIMKNVLNIENKKYVGMACTLTNNVFNITDEIINLGKIFNTLSFKLARGNESVLSEFACKKWAEEFRTLTLKLKKDIENGSTKYFYCLINGDDFYGTFLYKMFGNLRVGNRCDYLIKRFTVDLDGKIYGCPAASEYKELSVNNPSKILQKEELRRQFNECSNCEMKYLCGGECLLEIIRSGGTRKFVCELKKEVIKLTSYLKIYCLRNYPDFYKKIEKFCNEKKARSRKDPMLSEFLNKHPELNFYEAKKIYDKIQNKY